MRVGKKKEREMHRRPRGRSCAVTGGGGGAIRLAQRANCDSQPFNGKRVTREKSDCAIMTSRIATRNALFASCSFVEPAALLINETAEFANTCKSRLYTILARLAISSCRIKD